MHYSVMICDDHETRLPVRGQKPDVQIGLASKLVRRSIYTTPYGVPSKGKNEGCEWLGHELSPGVLRSNLRKLLESCFRHRQILPPKPMPASYATRLGIARKDVEKSLSDHGSRVFTLADIREILNGNRDFWRLGAIPIGQFLRLLADQFDFREVRLEFPNRPVARYLWGKATDFEIIQSINVDGYFSHYTAIRFHGLTLQLPKIVYFNIEQTVRPGGGTLTQEAIRNTFTKGKCRTSSNIASLNDISVCLINGGNTDNLGVIETAAQEDSSSLRITNIERTLIDAAVRPVYAGGVFEVKNAFAAAKERVSVNKLVSYLKTIGYTYPVHQSIGFYVERTGYRQSQINLLRQFPCKFDFYLDYGLKQAEYDSKWKLFYPKGL